MAAKRLMKVASVAPPPSLPSVPSSRVYMQIDASLSSDPDARIDTNEGLRMKVNYSPNPDSVLFFPEQSATYDATDAKVVKGRILSGADWAMARRDGVLVFDSRITLALGPEGNAYLLDSTLKGMIDLGQHEPSGTEDRDIFDRFVRGSNPNITRWATTLAVRFEGSGLPDSNQDVSWLPRRLQETASQFSMFKKLMRQQFIAYGTIEVTPGPYYPPRRIHLQVWGRE